MTSTAAPPGAFPKITKTTLAQLGPRLPLGNGPARDVVVRPWRMREERELGDLRDRNKDANMASFISMVLGHMCPTLGQRIELLSATERRAVIGQMFMGDVFYAYCWLRRDAMGPLVDLSLQCPSCRTKFSMKADLDTLEVSCAESVDDARWEYRLRKPVTVRGKTLVGLVMGPPRWNMLEMIRLGTSMGAAKPAVLLGSVHGLMGDGLVGTSIAEHEMDELAKVDVEALSAGVDQHSVGPDMSVEAACPRCASSFKTSIDWGYGSFFSSSST